MKSYKDMTRENTTTLASLPYVFAVKWMGRLADQSYAKLNVQ